MSSRCKDLRTLFHISESDYVFSHSFNPIVGYRLSYSVKVRIEKYYKGFSVREHPLNRGRLDAVCHLVF